MMKKTWIAAVAVLVLLYPLATWLIGFVIEKRIDAAYDQVRDKTPFVSVTEHRFQRGWYRSQEDVTVEVLHDFAAPAAAVSVAPFRITIHSVLHHGPLCGWNCFGLARAESHIVFNGALQSAIAGIFGSLEPLSLRSRMGFFGGGSATLSSPAFKDTVLDGGARAAWGGLEAEMRYAAGMDSYTLHLTAPRAMYTAADGKGVEATALTVDARSRRALRTLYVGESTLTLGRLAVAGAAGASTFTLNDLRSASSSGAQGGFMTMASKTSTGALVTSPLTLSGMHLDFTLRHLEEESLEQLSAGYRQANQNSALAPDARKAALSAVLRQYGTALLAQQPEIGIDRVSFANAQGEALLTGVMRLRDVTAADFAEGADPRGILAKLEAELDLSLDEALLQSLPGGANGEKQLAAMSEQGLMTHEQGKFHTKILFRHGQATFNGKPLRPGTTPAPPGSALPGSALPPPAAAPRH
jgi:uncharacterized protein YdgA (DUF945 family)